MIKFSIITVCYNEKERIRETIESVLNQSYNNFEYILIDGDSTDGSQRIISNYSHEIDKLIFEKDKGIYDAMNKGISETSEDSDLTIFMNGGDRFQNSNILEIVAFQAAQVNKNCWKVFHGNAEYDDGKKFISGSHPIYLENPYHHQATFYPTAVLKDLKGFDLQYTALADYNLNYFLSNHPELSFIKITETISLCDSNGKTSKPLYEHYKEEISIRNNHCKSKVLMLFGFIYSILRYLFRQLKAIF